MHSQFYTAPLSDYHFSLRVPINLRKVKSIHFNRRIFIFIRYYFRVQITLINILIRYIQIDNEF